MIILAGFFKILLHLKKKSAPNQQRYFAYKVVLTLWEKLAFEITRPINLNFRLIWRRWDESTLLEYFIATWINSAIHQKIRLLPQKWHQLHCVNSCYFWSMCGILLMCSVVVYFMHSYLAKAIFIFSSQLLFDSVPVLTLVCIKIAKFNFWKKFLLMLQI